MSYIELETYHAEPDDNEFVSFRDNTAVPPGPPPDPVGEGLGHGPLGHTPLGH